MIQPFLTIAELARFIEGEVLAAGAARPAAGETISGVAALADAGPGDASFFGNPKYLAALRRSRAGAVLVPPEFPVEMAAAATGGAVFIRVANPSLAFARLAERFTPPPREYPPGVAATAVLGRDVLLGPGVSVQPYAVIEDGAHIDEGAFIGAHVFVGAGARVGAGSRVYPHVVIREGCRIGRRVIIHGGAVIGGDGYGFELREGRHEKIPQTGIVQIDDDVEIGANAAIDRARFGKTHIGEGTKIDNLVHIAHNVVVGPHCLLVAQVGISGSTRLGQYVTAAGQVGIVGHVEIGDRAILAAQAGISKNVPAGEVVFSSPAEPLARYKEHQAYVRRLPKLNERVRKLEAELEALKELLRNQSPAADNL